MLCAGDQQRWSYNNPLLGAWFKSYLQRTRPSIVHFQAGYLLGAAPLQAAHAVGIPTVLTLHDYWYLCPRITLQRGDGSLCEKLPEDPVGCAWCICLEHRRNRIPDRLTHGLVGQAARSLVLQPERRKIADRRAHLMSALTLPDIVIAPSRFLAERFAPFVPPQRLHISSCGLDLEPFVAQQRPAPDKVLRIGFIGQIAPHKGIHLLVEAFHRMKTVDHPVELHIYGDLNKDPAYGRRLHRLAGEDSRIRFHGRFENSRVAAIIAGLSLLVVPSTWYEVGPLTILEAYAVGTPVIAAALGNMPDLVIDGVDGLHFRPNNASDLARQLQRLIDEPDLLQRLQSGIKMPRSIDDEMHQLMQIYHSLVPQFVSTPSEVA
jgi:glycosyltransferase involved in cell wall biosynthesis